MNWIFTLLIVGSVVAAALTGHMAEVTAAAIQSAKGAVDLVIALLGQMALWLGLLGIVRASGLMRTLSLAVAPVMVRLFPQVPKDHPAMGSMVLNLSANLLGLGNAATPLGLKAMRELESLNPRPGVATDAMALFLAMNTAGLQLLPVTAMAVRSAAGSKDPAGILAPSLLASFFGTVVAIAVAMLLARRRAFAANAGALPEPGESPRAAVGTEPPAAAAPPEPAPESTGGPRLAAILAVLAVVAYGLFRQVQQAAPEQTGFALVQQTLSDWAVPLVMLGIVLFAFGRRVRLYEHAVEGAKEALQVSVMIVPFLVLLLVAIGMFRASGAMEALVWLLGPLTAPLGLPAEAVPMALMRSFSGSGSLAVMTDVLKTHGADSFLGYLVSTIYGSSETTFYVLAVYFGSVQIRVTRHTLPACLAADAAGVAAAVFVCHVFFG